MLKDGVLRPYEVAAHAIYFFHEFLVAGCPNAPQLTDWMAKVDEVVKKHLRDGDESEQLRSRAADDISSDITPARFAHMQQTLSTLKAVTLSTAFRLPVDPISLNVPDYPIFIKEPMDLSTMEKKLNNQQYTTVKEYVREFKLIISDCYTYNGWEHAVSQLAARMDAQFDNLMERLPAIDDLEPAGAEISSPGSNFEHSGGTASASRRIKASRSIEVINVEDDDDKSEVTAAVNQVPAPAEAQVPSLKRRRTGPEKKPDRRMGAIDKKLEALIMAKTQHSALK